MTIYVDIDNTICETLGTNYSESTPITNAIKKVNQLYDEGHTIVYWTARGAVSGIDWRELTESQLKSWGAKYSELRLDKPAYDLFIDDKNINAKDWLQN
jgi:hypothetical protein